MELTKPSTLTFSQELMLAMKAKQEKEEEQKELQDCLRVLCVKCHHLLHEKYGYPQTLEEYYEFDTRGKSI